MRKYWKDKYDELKVGDILAIFANIVQPGSFDDLKIYGFGNPSATRPMDMVVTEGADDGLLSRAG